MRPMLDALELPQVQEITTYERRMLAEHKLPGIEGSLWQNLGRNPMCLVLWGVVTGVEALSFVEELNAKFLAGEPIAFVADIVADTEIETMVIDDLKIQELAGRPERFKYTLNLCEFILPAVPEETETQLVNDMAATDAAERQAEISDRIDLAQGTLEVVVESSEPNEDLSQIQIQVQGQTDDEQDYQVVLEQQTNGVFRQTDIPAGQYTVTLISA